MPHKIASRTDWAEARIDLLAREKEFNTARDALSAARRELPWVPLDEAYEFESEAGAISLSEMFAGRDQLVVYHFMFGTDWEQGCTSCSFWIDNLNGIQNHLAARDTTLALVSKGPLERLLSYRDRMGWSLPWYSSANNAFSEDYCVTFP